MHGFQWHLITEQVHGSPFRIHPYGAILGSRRNNIGWYGLLECLIILLLRRIVIIIDPPVRSLPVTHEFDALCSTRIPSVTIVIQGIIDWGAIRTAWINNFNFWVLENLGDAFLCSFGLGPIPEPRENVWFQCYLAHVRQMLTGNGVPLRLAPISRFWQQDLFLRAWMQYRSLL